MKTDELREKYLAFFQSKGHSRQPSDVLVPTWDPSVLFTPAGMNQFKDHFLGKVKLDFTRATTCQKCLRTGDIDNVGRTAYHHTFFEMLGNFSFGDYFKQEAIAWAWEFLTDKKWLGIDPQRLHVTVYKDDDEAAKIWHEKIGLATSRISRMDEDENFWPASAPSLGPDGVCGPCSEIYYQLDNGKDVEIWNLVFTQFNRVGEPPDNLRPLPSKNIDTGMGLERTASVMQNVPTNFHIDILRPILDAAAEVCGVKYEYESDNGRRLRRITDHIRACTFAVHENILPGPKKARYVIKRLLRRAVLDGHQMGLREPFLHHLVSAVAESMGTAYPELKSTVGRVCEVIRKEENDFFSTIGGGLERIGRVFETMQAASAVMVDGNEAASLYQTYGVPPELFQALAAERELTFDWDGYRQAMEQHEKVSGGGRGELFATGPIETLKEALRKTEFVGYEKIETSAQVKGIVIGRDDDAHLVSELKASDAKDQEVRIVLDRSPCYGEGGGQVGDAGSIFADESLFEIADTQRAGDLLVHIGKIKAGKFSAGMHVTVKVDVVRRDGIRRAHSATHILHHALQSIVGGHAQQQGSKVDADWLRFDFTNQAPLSDEQIRQVETVVAEKVQRADPISWKIVPLAEARQAGAMMLFGEKYPDPVRMVSMGEFSKELCGGTHLTNTSQVEQFEVIAEESVSAGTRRLVAYTGQRAQSHRLQVQALLQAAAKSLACHPGEVAVQVAGLTHEIRSLKKQLAGSGSGAEEKLPARPIADANHYLAQRNLLRDAARLLNVAVDEVPARIAALQEERTKLAQQVAALAASGSMSADTLLQSAAHVAGVSVVVAETPGATPNLMRQWIDQIRQKSSEPTAVLFANKAGDDKVLLVAGISKALQERGLSASHWIGEVAPIVGGGGGGKADLAQAGGKFPDKIPEAVEAAKKSIAAMLNR
jgi:alanyl-tRNA synthetase